MSDSKHIFISHASSDDAFVKQLRSKLESLGLKVWVDSRNLRGGDKLKPEIEKAIQSASHVLVILSPKTMNSIWVRDEIQMAEQVANTKNDYRVIPLLLDGVEASALGLWFKEEPTGIKISMEVGQLNEKLPDILAALDGRLPDDSESAKEIDAKPIAEMLLELSHPKIKQQEDGSFQLSSEASLEYIPDDSTQQGAKSKPFIFTSPIGQIEQDDLRWYLEKYPIWPTGLFQKRAKQIESQLPQWGKSLFDAVFDHKVCQAVLSGWDSAKKHHERRFSIRIDAELPEQLPEQLPEGSDMDEQSDEQSDEQNDKQGNALEAASQLIALPWELLHDGKNWLSDGAHPVRVRRRLPNYSNHPPLITQLPIRILLLSPRPEQNGVGYLDHRGSALPLVDAVAKLGDLAEVHVLSPAILPALEAELQRAKADNTPYHVLHFDGHGVYDIQHGLGALCFEHPKDSDKLTGRVMQLVYAKYQEGNPDSEHNIASLLHEYRIPLVFLEACQSAQSEINPNASVAASLLEEGVASVVAMSHSVLVKSATIFVTAFYQELAQGQRLGQAMLAGQKALMADSFRFPILGAGELHMTDWFVPILYQEKHDPQLFARIPSDTAHKMQQQQQQTSLGALPDTPPHSFIGRSRELLALERLLEQEQQPYAVIRGQGGIGKTTIAVELSRWLVRSGRYDRCAFVSLETYSHARAVLDALGQQLVGKHYSVAEYGNDLDKAMQPLQRVLENERCLLLLDNMESLLADKTNTQSVLQTLQQLQSSDHKTRLLFTSRENLPAPFHHPTRQIELGELSEDDAKALIMQVMAAQGLQLKHDDQGRSPEQVDDLIREVHGHARALVLLATELASQGVEATTDNLRHIMQQLERDHKGQRELSLFASIELSLRRLSVSSRERLNGLAVFHDGGILHAIAHVLAIDSDTAQQLASELIQVGLAEDKGYGYLRLDPALPSYLSLQLSEQDRQHFALRWTEVMSLLVNFLYKQKFEDVKLQAQLTQLELPNLMSFIRKLSQQMQQGHVEAETVSHKAGCIEQLLANLNYPQALAEVVAIRQLASQLLGDWSHARFVNERLSIERLLAQGDVQQAYTKAEKLQQRCEQAEATAYAGMDFDLAYSHWLFGRVLKKGGAATQALVVLRQAFESFEALGDRGARMASVSLTEMGDCLRDLGQLEEAATVYQENIQCAEKLDDKRQVAVAKGQLASVRLLQKDYVAGMQGYQQALVLFQQLDEPLAQATIYHQIGMVYKQQRQFEQAETAYRQSLSIKIQQSNRAGEASSLGELANLYNEWNRPEQAVEYYRQAIDIAIELDDKAAEGRQRSNLAHTLIKLNRLDQARPELLRAIECNKPYGHAAQPWTAWAILYNLEQAAGNPQAAHQARQEAIQAFFAYRRDGGRIMRVLVDWHCWCYRQLAREIQRKWCRK